MAEINSLVSEILAETKRQQDHKAEYTKNVFEIINSLKKENRTLSFHWYSRRDGAEMISFSSNYLPDNMTKWHEEQYQKSFNEMIKAINYLFTKGKEEGFFEYLCKRVLPQFMQDVSSPCLLDFRVK